MTEVSIAACPEYSREQCRRALLEVLEPLGGLNWVNPGMIIAVKANLVGAMKPEEAGTTHPILLCAMVELLKERGAEVIIGDSPGGLYNDAFVGRVYRVAGMQEP